MQKHLLLVAVLFTMVACTSENNAPTTMPATTEDSSALVPVDNTPLTATDANVYEYMSGPQGPMSVHIYAEDDIWIIEQNRIAEDGLPTPVDRWTFTTKEKAYAFATQKLGLTEAQRNDTALDKDPSSDVLFSENLNSGTVLWETKNTWNWEWEKAFAKWMRENLHPDFFQKLGIENDCADAYYQARMIFAYENSLPVSFRLAGNGAYFTQNVVRPDWKKLKTDKDWRKNQRFLAALDYIANTTYTHTLGRDTYPIKISGESLIEGTAFLYLDQHSGHTLLVNEINLGHEESSKTRLPMYTLNSTVPKTVRPLYEAMFYEQAQPEKSKIGHTGFVRFRWPKSSGAAALVDADKMPYYSLEQYDENFMNANEEDEGEYRNFSLTVFKRLNPDFDPTLRITEGLSEVSEMMEARKEVVVEGYKVCQKGCVEGSADYENWSTPSRDKRIKNLIADLELYQAALYGIDTVVQAWEQALDKNIIELEGLNYIFSHVQWTFTNDLHSSDPNVTPGERWGLSPEAFANAAARILNPQLEARKNKINKKNDCKNSPSCLLFSNEYIDKSTFVEDQDMQTSISLRNQYCSQAGDLLCTQFKAELATLPTSAPGHANLLESWEKIYLLNSDPTVPAEQRWGTIPSKYNSLTLSGAFSVIEKYSNLLILNKEAYPASEISTLNEDTKKFETIAQLPKGGSTALNSKNGLLAIVDNNANNVAIVDLTTGQKQILELPDVTASEEYSFYGSSTWMDDGNLVINYQNKIIGFSLVNGQFVTNNVVHQDAYLAGTSGYIYKTKNLEQIDAQQPDWQVTLINIFDESLPPVTLKVSDVFGKTNIGYISFTGHITKKAALFQWTRYTDTATLNGFFRIDLATGAGAKVNDMPQYMSMVSSTVASASNYGNDGTQSSTKFVFFNDDLSVSKTTSVPGYCDNCYGEGTTGLRVGNDIYNIDLENKTLVKTLEVLGVPLNAQVRLSNLYSNLGIFTYSDDTQYYSVLYDLKKQAAITSGESLSFNTQLEGLIPLLSMSQSHEVGSGSDKMKYYSLNLIYDLSDLSAGPIATPGSMYYGGGEGEYEGEEGYLIDGGEAGADGKNMIPLPQHVPFMVRVLDPSVIQEKTDKVSIINMSSYQTVFIFK